MNMILSTDLLLEYRKIKRITKAIRIKNKIEIIKIKRLLFNGNLVAPLIPNSFSSISKFSIDF